MIKKQKNIETISSFAKVTWAICILLLFSPAVVFSKQNTPFRVMFYNVENLFDTQHDSTINDVDFTPEGRFGWTEGRYQQKLSNIADVITSLPDKTHPTLIGLCEIENNKVLTDLVATPQLSEADYGIIHSDSPDSRGIDVALLYKKDKYKPIYEEFLQVDYFNRWDKKTRDILYCVGTIETGDTLHVFVTHFPSRFNAEDYRLFVASNLRHKVDSLLASNANSLIVIMGDFNDTPNDKSVSGTLKANQLTEATSVAEKELYNLYHNYRKGDKTGTCKYNNKWTVFDQLMVSGALLKASKATAYIFDADFLLEPDKNNTYRPKRTYMGNIYQNGFSDHLPVYVDFIFK